MTIFKPWTWFNSEERKLKNEMLKAHIAKMQFELEKQVQEANEIKEWRQAQNTPTASPDPLDLIPSQPYRSLRLINNTVHVALHDGTVLTKSGVDKSFYQQVKDSLTEDDVVSMFIELAAPKGVGKSEQVQVETEEEIKTVSGNLGILKVSPDFEVKEGKVYLKGVDLAMPASVSGSFIEILEKQAITQDENEELKLQEAYQALKMFWYWTALNPVESSRNDLLSFVRREDIKITKNGLLEMYRRVVNRGAKDKSLVNFISNNYYKVKKWKKSPASYRVVKTGSSSYQLEKTATPKIGGELIGNLETLYLDLPNMTENIYTDAHTMSKEIKIGQVYREDEDKIDLDNTRSCSTGLHVGSHTFMFSGFGDTGVLALVNPSKVRSVPYYEGNKMRVSEMFIAAVVDIKEYKESITESDIADYSQEYFNYSAEELNDQVKNKEFSSLTCQDNLPAVSMKNIEEIKEILMKKVTLF